MRGLGRCLLGASRAEHMQGDLGNENRGYLVYHDAPFQSSCSGDQLRVQFHGIMAKPLDEEDEKEYYFLDYDGYLTHRTKQIYRSRLNRRPTS